MAATNLEPTLSTDARTMRRDRRRVRREGLLGRGRLLTVRLPSTRSTVRNRSLAPNFLYKSNTYRDSAGSNLLLQSNCRRNVDSRGLLDARYLSHWVLSERVELPRGGVTKTHLDVNQLVRLTFGQRKSLGKGYIFLTRFAIGKHAGYAVHQLLIGLVSKSPFTIIGG